METLLRYQNALSRPSVPLLNRLGARIELDRLRRPVATIGTSSIVFRLSVDGGDRLALRLPLEEASAAEWAVRYGALQTFDGGDLASRMSNRFDVYRQSVSVVSDAGIDAVPLTALVSTWIEGPTLLAAADRAARSGKTHILRALAGAVRDAVSESRRVGFVHGDITPQNLIVDKTGQIAFIDLDSVSWPGSPLGTVGSGTPGYRHPAGAAPSATRDAFALLVIYASLIALAEQPNRRLTWGDAPEDPDASLLLSDWDLGSPETSEVFRDITSQRRGDAGSLFTALRRVIEEGPTSIERHIGVIPSLAPVMETRVDEDTANLTWDLNAAVRRVQHRFDGGTPGLPTPAATAPDFDHPTWEASGAKEPVVEDEGTMDDLRVALRSAVKARNESDVARLWPKLARDPISRTMTLQIAELYATTYVERIEREHQQGRDVTVLAIGDEARLRQIPLPSQTRRLIRDARERTNVRSKLDRALSSDSREDLADLAMSGQLAVLGDADRGSLVRVLQALEWPLLQRALETDDDRIISNAYDDELFEGPHSLPSAVSRRVDLARARLQWAERLRAALRQRLAGEVTVLIDASPDRAESHLSATERRRAHKMVEQHRALGGLADAIKSGDETAIVGSLAVVERVGARLGEHFPWHAIRDVLERVSLIEDIIQAAETRPIDHARLAQLIPAAKAMGMQADPRLSGDLALDTLQTKLIQAAHLRRLRAAIEQDVDLRIVGTALPDVYDVLDQLTDDERSRVARAIRSERRHDRQAVAAKFDSA